jgi:hypothetical protein
MASPSRATPIGGSTLSQKQRMFLRNASECIWEQVPWPVNFRRRFNPPPSGNFRKHLNHPPPFGNFQEIQRRNKNLSYRIRSIDLMILREPLEPLHYCTIYKLSKIVLILI